MANEQIINQAFSERNIKWVGYAFLIVGIVYMILGIFGNKNISATEDVGNKIEALKNTQTMQNGFILLGIGIVITMLTK